MTLGLILLDDNNRYVDNNGNLPKAPSWDKKLLYSLSKYKDITISRKTYESLPKSVKEDTRFNFLVDNDGSIPYDINWGIKPFYEVPPDMLIVVKALENLPNGKVFNPSELFDCIVDLSALSIWTKKETL